MAAPVFKWILKPVFKPVAKPVAKQVATPILKPVAKPVASPKAKPNIEPMAGPPPLSNAGARRLEAPEPESELHGPGDRATSGTLGVPGLNRGRHREGHKTLSCRSSSLTYPQEQTCQIKS